MGEVDVFIMVPVAELMLMMKHQPQAPQMMKQQLALATAVTVAEARQSKRCRLCSMCGRNQPHTKGLARNKLPNWPCIRGLPRKRHPDIDLHLVCIINL